MPHDTKTTRRCLVHESSSATDLRLLLGADTGNIMPDGLHLSFLSARQTRADSHRHLYVKSSVSGNSKQASKHPSKGMMTFHVWCSTPEYMSPELLHNGQDGTDQAYDPRSTDVWAAGVMLVVALCGAFPFDHTQHHHRSMEEAELDLWYAPTHSPATPTRVSVGLGAVALSPWSHGAAMHVLPKCAVAAVSAVMMWLYTHCWSALSVNVPVVKQTTRLGAASAAFGVQCQLCISSWWSGFNDVMLLKFQACCISRPVWMLTSHCLGETRIVLHLPSSFMSSVASMY